MGIAKALPRIKTEHVCQTCGYRTPRWLGRCPGCDAWASLAEEPVAGSPSASRHGGLAPAGGRPTAIDRVESGHDLRDRTGIGELDRALGGGLVPGAAVLLAGDPGIGKSTLLLAALDRLARLPGGRPILYVSGEESLGQIRLRGERLSALSPGLILYSETDAARALAAAEELRPRVLAVDSVQTMSCPELASAAGSVSQVREVAARLVAWAKRTGTPLLLVGHVTKDGSVAGPRVLEHMVDAVLYFEGDRSHAYRVLRAHKNRFGSTNEIGVFEMKAEGLCEVPNPSALFLAERPRGAAGSAVVATLNGSRPLLVEVQALVADAGGPGAARRGAIGVDPGRVALLTAVLEKKEGLFLADKDLYVNVAGGASLQEPAGDLAIAAALCSSARDAPIDPRTLLLGEIGLAGEVRAVSQIEQRLGEAAQLGFTRCVLPAGNAKRLGASPLLLLPAAGLSEALAHLFG
ncbi:MAG: DNA repair protein RadA [Myxococcales bacterium]